MLKRKVKSLEMEKSSQGKLYRVEQEMSQSNQIVQVHSHMADALLSALSSTILTNLDTFLQGEFATVSGLPTEFHHLQSTFTTIQAVLRDAEDRPSKSEALKIWLKKLKDTAYDVDDLLDEFAIYAQRPNLPNTLKTHVRTFFSAYDIVFKVMMSHKLKGVREKLDAIAAERLQFHLQEEGTHVSDRVVGVLDGRETTPLVDESKIIGREEEKEELISMVLTSSRDLSVFALWGMAGLGKTTLAQVVFNEQRVVKHFDLRIWVCVSDDFGVKRLTRAMLEYIEGCPPECRELAPLQRRLQEKLTGKKLLLVLDDVWNEKSDKWDGLLNTVRCGATGSVVLVTTRCENIARRRATKSVGIERLSNADSWSLFHQTAFGSESKEEYAQLKIIGRDIVKKCGGVPLAIKAMGSLLQFKREEEEWSFIKESEVWDLPDEGSMILPALRLSYNHLTPHLRQCFAFCSIFPKDCRMEKDQLIELWMANGFIPCKRKMDLFDEGKKSFDELVWRSFFQDIEEDYLGNTTCKMHDLVHDLAQSVMVDECYLIQSTKDLQNSKKFRHLSVGVSQIKSSHESNKLFKGQSLRSLLWHDCQEYSRLSSYLSGQKHLRVLDLYGSRLEKFPLSVDRLKHLRYLDFSRSRVRSLPESITSLQNLQIMKLCDCFHLCNLPEGLKLMTDLIDLDIAGSGSLFSMPAEMGKLTCLRKLSNFIVGNNSGHRIGELKELNLEGHLSIEQIEHVRSYRDAKSANLLQKKDLKFLSLSWSKEGENSIELAEEVLDGLQPHRNLKKLKMSNYRGSKFPNWMMDLKLQNLVEIKLFGCDNCEQLPPFGKLRFLKNLQLQEMKSVKQMGNEMYGDGETAFPSLEILSLIGMDGLEQWVTPVASDHKEHYPVLKCLWICDCPKLMHSPIIPSLDELEIQKGSEKSIKLVQNFSSIRRLTIEDSTVTCLPDGLLQKHALLEVLRIEKLSNLKSLGNPLDKLSALKELRLEHCEQLDSLPDGLCSLNSLETILLKYCGIKSFPPVDGFSGLSSLRRLWFIACKELEFLSEGVRNLTALENFIVSGLPKLKSLPDGIGNLPALQELVVARCHEDLNSLPDGSWTALQTLSIRRCPKLKSLPDGIGNLTALRTLRIEDCEGLSFLPNQIGNLMCLSKLEIWYCLNLRCLPEEMRELKMLRELVIAKCPHLMSRCKKDSGEDWSKIAHIPDIDVWS